MIGSRDVTKLSTVELLEGLERFNRIIGDIRGRGKCATTADIEALKRCKGRADDVRNELLLRLEKAAEQITA